ncbi:MAG: TonB-dependent receptor plug domain-containing protein, partial [Pseudomonadales bacterium]|nr:TonB-dependent receptor plug domain-containing protein [Pseudomonadales bacterium]
MITYRYLLFVSLLFASIARADHAAKAEFYEEITILGDQNIAETTTGSAHFLSDEELELFEYADIQRVLRTVPGISIQVEDGYGLRPNIGIRGVPTERSARVVLLEDNVLIAPAPYAASAAYYFPTMGRMYNVEVVKGPSAITQGPNTVGGAVNFVSTPIPRNAEGKINLEVGEDSTTRSHLTYGATDAKGFGFMLETHQWKSGGYQSIDRSNTDTGLDVEDYTVKLAYAPDDSRHAMEFKYQYAQQDSNQSYLGLTDADFASDAYRRYGVSGFDNIATEHNQYILRYEYALNERTRLTATAYNNDHKRSWFKTEKLDVDQSAASDFDSWFDIVQSVNRGESRGDFSAAGLQAILDGADTPANTSIQLRDNNREYYSRGL